MIFRTVDTTYGLCTASLRDFTEAGFLYYILQIILLWPYVDMNKNNRNQMIISHLHLLLCSQSRKPDISFAHHIFILICWLFYLKVLTFIRVWCFNNGPTRDKTLSGSKLRTLHPCEVSYLVFIFCLEHFELTFMRSHNEFMLKIYKPNPVNVG